ncbi:MAG: PhnD/SsuA/transferrin family substrate-binding protein [Gallionella sp.]
MSKTFSRLFVVFLLMLVTVPLFAQDEVKIGILSSRPKSMVLARWSPLAVALNKAIPGYHFAIGVYNLDELHTAVAARQVDFVLSNPGNYLLMSHLNGLSAPLVTLSNLEQGQPVSLFGGVMFTRADRADIRRLQDIRGKSVAATRTDSFAGYQTQVYELAGAGIHLPHDVKLMFTGMPQDNVVEAVLARRADVGFVRSGLLERLVREGKLDMSQVAVINPQTFPDFPVQVSTRLYPEWPLSALPQTSKELKRKVSSFLLTVNENKSLAAALRINGFDVPADYSSVEEVLRELRVPPFDVAPEFTSRDVWQRYRWEIVLGLATFTLILLLGLNLLRVNRSLVTEKNTVQTRSNQLKESNRLLDDIVTERRIAMEQLRLAAHELEQANAQIETERARLAERVLERTTQLMLANKAKDSFLATMSHEIRTPLGGLLGMMELLSLSQLNKEQTEMLHIAQNSGKSLLRIVDDILDWSKIEAGKLELAPRPALLVELLKGVANTYAHVASAKGLVLQQHIDDNLSAAYICDPLRISQILNNFTSNAIKFTEHGSIELNVELIAQHAGKDRIRFSVTDSGVGIDAEQQSRLFQHYEQASSDTARMYGGTGLGLAICRRLSELMEGDIGVESTPGIGSTFYFTVSMVAADIDAQRGLQQSNDFTYSNTFNPLTAEGRQRSILVVDDHPVNRMLLKQQLDQLGLYADIADAGIVGLSLWWTGHYDLVITDCHMPGMDGYELARSIREIEQHDGRPRIPIIAWTANALAEEVEYCHAAGMDDLLTKPTVIADLSAMLTKWLQHATIPDQSTPSENHMLKLSTETLVALDLSVLNRLAPGYTAQTEMLQEFARYHHADVAELKVALAQDDSKVIAQAAHRVKGACRMVGAMEMEDICARIEKAGRDGDVQGARDVADATLEMAVARLDDVINRLVKGQ